MIKFIIISGTNFTEVETKMNRFLVVNRISELIQVVNLSDEQYVAVGIYYRIN